MAKKADGKEKKEKKLPPKMLHRVAALLAELFEENGNPSLRKASEMWGLDYTSLGKARAATGGAGVHFLLRLRELAGQPIDTILGLPPIPKERLRTPLARRQAALIAAIEEAQRMGCPEPVIADVVKNQVMNAANDDERREAWLRAFLKAWGGIRRVPEITTEAQAWLDAHPAAPAPDQFEPLVAAAV